MAASCLSTFVQQLHALSGPASSSARLDSSVGAFLPLEFEPHEKLKASWPGIGWRSPAIQYQEIVSDVGPGTGG
jgi:hypothetical protein